MTGTVYLIHFDRPIGDLDNPRGQARHYLGYTDDLAARLEAHASGNGARLMEVVAERGIGWVVARTWRGDRSLERRLKNRHNAPKLCPICGESPTQQEENRMTMGAALFELFAAHGTTTAEIAALDLGTVTRRVGEMREAEPDCLPLTDAEIAEAILDFAREAVGCIRRWETIADVIEAQI